MKPMRIVIAGGGTGGHLYPGIAVARELLRREPQALISFAGTARGIEARVVPREKFELDLLRSAGLKGKSLMVFVRGLLLLPLSAIDVLMAALRGVPTLLLEQNAVPGLTNRLLARIVSAAAVTFESTTSFFGRRAFVAGNPVRPEFLSENLSPAIRPPGPARILIVGGSQGSHAINVAMVEAAPKLAAHPGGLAITHQTGERDLELVSDGYSRAGLEARVEPFLFAMDREVSAADLVICRAGATTLAELTAAGRPSVLIPLPTAADDHQRKNAEVLAAAGAAELLEQKRMTGALLAERITALIGDEARLTAMAVAARRLARPDAAMVIADKAFELVRRS